MSEKKTKNEKLGTLELNRVFDLAGMLTQACNGYTTLEINLAMYLTTFDLGHHEGHECERQLQRDMVLELLGSEQRKTH